MVDVTQQTEMVLFFGEHYARQAAQLVDVATGAVGLRRTGLRFQLDHCCGERVLEAVLGDDCSDAVCQLYAQAVEQELDALVSEDDDQHREGEILDYVTIDLVELSRCGGCGVKEIARRALVLQGVALFAAEHPDPFLTATDLARSVASEMPGSVDFAELLRYAQLVLPEPNRRS